MKIKKKLIKYLTDPINNDNYKLVGVSSQYDYNLRSSLSWVPSIKIKETYDGGTSITLGVNLESSQDSVFETIVDLTDFLNIGIDVTKPSEIDKPVKETQDYQFIDMINGTGYNQVPYRELELVINDDDPKWELTREVIKLGSLTSYTKLVLKYKSISNVPIIGDTTPGDIQFTFLITQTTSDLYSMFTPVFNHILKPTETNKLLQLIDVSSFSLISAELHTQGSTATGSLFPVGEAFGISYSKDRQEISIGSMAGVIYVPLGNIQSSTIEKLSDVANSRGYVMNIKINHGNIKLLLMEN